MNNAMHSKRTLSFTVENDDGDEVEITLPSKFEVCGRCGGCGTHTNPNVDGHGITESEWANDWSEEEKETYFAGGYDVTCEECKGERVVAVIDEARCTPKQKEDLELVWRAEEQEREYNSMCAAERRMGY